MSYEVLARKYRPKSFSEVYSQEHIVRIFENSINSGRIGQAYLFTGSRGVGKTSVARILAKSLNCIKAESINPCNVCPNCIDIAKGCSADVSEIDGASNTGVDDVRELQKELLYAAANSRYKIIIIDEVHMLSKNAFNALLKTLEEPPPKVIFIFATTEPHKVLPTIISRCQRFDFKKIPVDMIVKRLKEIAILEKISINDEALFPIAKKADGGMRDALSLLDQVISYGIENITIKDVENIFGLVGYEVFNRFMECILRKNPQEIIIQFHNVSEQGIDIQEVINNYLEYLRQFLFIKLGIYQEGIAKNIYDTMQILSKSFTEDEILYIINYLIETKNNLRTSAAPDVLAELTFIKIAKISEMNSLKSILDTLSSGKLVLDTVPQPTPLSAQVGDALVRPASVPSTIPVDNTERTSTFHTVTPVVPVDSTERTSAFPTESPVVPIDNTKNATNEPIQPNTESPQTPILPKSENVSAPLLPMSDSLDMTYQPTIDMLKPLHSETVPSNVPIDNTNKTNYQISGSINIEDLNYKKEVIINQINANQTLSTAFFETAKLKEIQNNTLFYTHTSEIATNKLNSEKQILESIFSSIFYKNIKLSFEHAPDTKIEVKKNPTLEEIEEENPVLAEFIYKSNSTVKQDK